MGNELMLVRPSSMYADQVMAYKEEMLAHGDSLDGCAGLEKCATYDEWANFAPRLQAAYGDAYVPSEVFLAVRQRDRCLVGIADYRHPLTDFLREFGGNIGYSVRPSERGQGIGTRMLWLLLPICRAMGEERVLVTCDKANAASARIIQKNGGVLEKEVADTVGLSRSGTILRYWIDLLPLKED